jgi:hypothetical protein
VNVVSVNKTIEVRPYECNSTTIVKKITSKFPDFDFMLYIGEPINIEFPPEKNAIFTVSVGSKSQKYYLHSSNEVVYLLEHINDKIE